MNILVLSWRDPKHPLAGGAEQVMHEHMKGWVKAKHHVTLFSSRYQGSVEKETLDGVKIIRQGNEYLGVQIAGFLHYIKNKNVHDLVVDQFHGIPFFTPLYARKPILAVVQETAREVWFLNYLSWPINLMVGLIGYISEPFIFLLYIKVTFMTGSESAKEDIIKFGIPANNVNIVPHGVVIKRLTSMPKKEDKKTIIYLGKLSKDKGIEDALKCFAILNKQDDYNFWIVGKAETKDYEKKIQKIVLNLGLTSKIIFWGYVTQEKKFALLAKAHLLINPSIKEGWGLVNIEANAMGTPIVAYKSQGLVDSVKHNMSGIICNNNDPENLACELVKICKDDVLYKKLSEGAVIWSKQFSWDNSKNMSLELIKKVSNEA